MTELKSCPFCGGEPEIKYTTTRLADILIDTDGLTNAKLAEEVGCHPHTISDFMRYKQPRTKTKLMRKIADYLGVSVDYMMGKSENFDSVRCSMCHATAPTAEAWNTRHERTCNMIGMNYVNHATWEETHIDKVMCSECGHEFYFYYLGCELGERKYRHNYCSNCGTKVIENEEV